MDVSRIAPLMVFCALVLGSCGNEVVPAPIDTAWCPDGSAVEVDGHRRLALIVGVGDYASSRVPDLAGPPNDARRMHALLTGKDGYGFPAQNVCVLLDSQATTQNFRDAFRERLIEQARPGDVAVVFFAGHGSQTRDTSGDEPDGWDETFVLHDARTGDVRDFSDDEMNDMLVDLHRKTRHITVIFDACNSGTAARADSRFASRFIVPSAAIQTDDVVSEGDGGTGLTTDDLSGLVALTAAADGTSALERDGNGVFTDALLQVLGQASEHPLTYAQVARLVPPLVAAGSRQVPYFQGDLRRAVFGNRGRTRPVGLDVVSVGPELELSGAVLPGLGIGAELRIYDGAAHGDIVNDPARAKAVAVVIDTNGVRVRARPVSMSSDSEPVAPGDLAVIARPADDSLTIRLRLRLGETPSGQQRSERLTRMIRAHPEASRLVQLVESGEDFELSALSDDRLILRGPENRVRNTFVEEIGVAPALWRHARQRALLQLRGEGGGDFSDNETLRVQLIPAKRQPPCADGRWVQAAANQDQIVPLCHAWNLKVMLSESAPVPLLIGAALLSADGSMFGLPRDGRTVRLRPGESVVFDDNETFRGMPPLDSADRILVFGTQERNPVAWYQLTQVAETRDAPTGGLARALRQYLQPGTRGGTAVRSSDQSTWTLSSLGIRVEANSRFLSAAHDGPIRTREYTIPQFDVRPYLPDDPGSVLRRVLEVADQLTSTASGDGIPYKQHDWSLDSDAANLARGIDCSRSIWFAFTRAGLTYNRANRYLYTGLMIGEDSPMTEQFDICPADAPYQIGDVLVYRSDTRGDGHTVMVIDPEKRISWGSMGWDGNAKASDYVIAPDTGVEYQRIKYKPDWRRWDRSDMTLRACWRYRQFSAELASGQGLPGVTALGVACEADHCTL